MRDRPAATPPNRRRRRLARRPLGAALALALAAWMIAAPLPAAAAGLSAADRAAYAQAFDAAGRGQWSAALDAAGQARDPVLRDVLTWQWLQQPGSGASFATLRRFMADHPDWPAMATLQRRAEDALTGNEPPRELLAWFAANPPASGRGKMLLAEALDSTGDPGAADMVRAIWANDSLGRADERRFMARFARLLSADLHAKRAATLLWEGDPDGARRLLEHLAPGQRALIQARMALQGKAANVEKLVAAVPPGLQDDPGLVYDRLRWRRAKGLEDGAVELLRHPAANQVRPHLWWRERAVLARSYLERGWISRAYEIASRHGMTSGMTAGAGAFAEAEWLSGWIALRFLKDGKTALAHFTRMHGDVATPISLGRAAYWAGRAAEEIGDQAAARTWYAQAGDQVTTFYGQLAAERLGSRPSALPPEPQPSAEDRAAFDRAPLVRVARALAAIGRVEETRPFLIRLADDLPTPAQQAMAVRLAREFGRLDMAVALSRRLAMRGVHAIEDAYPLPDVALPQVPERALVLALIRQESNFHTHAVSHAGARGLMQLMPATAKHVAKGLGLGHSDAALTADPDYNVRLGTTYLAELLDRFGGSYPMAVAAYNAGPGRPARWMKQFGDPRRGEIDVVDWVEMIPFTETRNYVQRVMEGLQVYRHRLGHTELAFRLDRDLKR